MLLTYFHETWYEHHASGYCSTLNFCDQYQHGCKKSCEVGAILELLNVGFEVLCGYKVLQSTQILWGYFLRTCLHEMSGAWMVNKSVT
jgi:hypothetical protein